MSKTIKTQSIYLWYRVKQRKKKGNNFVKALTTRVECRSLGLVTKMSLLLDCAMSTSLFWIGEDKRYLKIQLIEPLIRHFAYFRMISKLSFTEQLSVRLLLVRIICGIFRYSTVPFLKLRAHTVFIRWQIEL